MCEYLYEVTWKHIGREVKTYRIWAPDRPHNRILTEFQGRYPAPGFEGKVELMRYRRIKTSV